VATITRNGAMGAARPYDGAPGAARPYDGGVGTARPYDGSGYRGPRRLDRDVRRGLLAWTVPLFGLGGAGLLAWTGYLAASLPAHSVSAHYNVAWAGFDTLLAGLVLSTAWLAHRRSPRVGSTAMATATLLCADAWFDITTAAAGRPLLGAILLAAFVELPAAALALQVHRAASRRTRRASEARPF
jgi:hypothetical protein